MPISRTDPRQPVYQVASGVSRIILHLFERGLRRGREKLEPAHARLPPPKSIVKRLLSEPKDTLGIFWQRWYFKRKVGDFFRKTRKTVKQGGLSCSKRLDL